MWLRGFVVAGAVASLAVAVSTLPRLPSVSPVPLVAGLVPWLVGKYVLCPLRWWVVTEGAPPAGWHVRVFAEAELLGMLTPGHVGSDVWRVHRLTLRGTTRPDAVVSVGLDRLVGGVALAGFVVAASATLPLQLLTPLGVGAAVAGAAVLVARRRWPRLAPRQPLPGPARLAAGLMLSAGYQLSIAALLVGILAAAGHPVAPVLVVGAFGVAQVAGVVPGPHGASPRDAALAVGLVALGVPWAVAAGAVALKATLAWLPALVLGGAALWLTQRPGGAGALPRLSRCPSPSLPSRSTAW